LSSGQSSTTSIQNPLGTGYIYDSFLLIHLSTPFLNFEL
jgi:hypothetical protein